MSRVDFVHRKSKAPKRLYLLLHGYHQCGEDFFQAVEGLIPPDGEVIAPNGPFPLPRTFPLDADRKHKELFRAFAWYFYDAKKKRYLIDYGHSATLLANLLEHLKIELPVTIVGYSQGGYLGPFAAEKIPTCDHLIGLNCSWRGDKLKAPLKIRIDSINGAEDEVVNPRLAHDRHLDLIAAGAKGEFHLIEKEAHALRSGALKCLKNVLS